MMLKKNGFMWLIIIFSPNIFIFCISEKVYFKYINDLETQIIQENDNVISANVLYDEGDWGEFKLRILITFRDNQWILLSNVTEKQDKTRIVGVNGYRILGYNRKKNDEGNIIFDEWRHYLSNKLVFERVLNVRFENINKIIKSFDEIAEYMEFLKDIDSEKFQDKSIEWLWSDEADGKRIGIWNEWVDEQILFKAPIWEHATVDHIREKQGVSSTRLNKMRQTQ